jgi:hypothetical protein
LPQVCKVHGMRFLHSASVVQNWARAQAAWHVVPALDAAVL